MMIVLLVAMLFFYPPVFADDSIPVEAEFSNKIVYTTDAAFDKDVLSKDCERRRGVFNECGSVCDEQKNGVTCIDVCAFTCEFDQAHNSVVAEDYKALRQACQDDRCCLSSINNMESSGGYRIFKGECPEGYQWHALKCKESYKWCQPAKK